MKRIRLTVEMSMGRLDVFAIVQDGGEAELCDVGSTMARDYFEDEATYRNWRARAAELLAVVRENEQRLLSAW